MCLRQWKCRNFIREGESSAQVGQKTLSKLKVNGK